MRSSQSPSSPVTLTAAAAPDFAQIAALAAELTGRDIGRVVLDDEQWVAQQAARGTPEAFARLLLGFYQAARQGHFAGVGPLLGELLGREPRSVRDLLVDRVGG